MHFHPQPVTTTTTRKHSIWMNGKIISTPCTKSGVGKLFNMSKKHCKWFSVIFKAPSLEFNYGLLSLRVKILRPPPPLYLYIVKIENFHPVLTPSLTWWIIKKCHSHHDFPLFLVDYVKKWVSLSDVIYCGHVMESHTAPMVKEYFQACYAKTML